MDTTNNRVQVHDGMTPGGFPAAKLSDLPTRAGLGAAAAGSNADITALTALNALNGGALAGLRNLVVNGDFVINQRQYASGAAVGAGVYMHDRWQAVSPGGASYTFASTTNAFGVAPQDIDVTLTLAAGAMIAQKIEPAVVGGGAYTLSWSGTAAGQIVWSDGTTTHTSDPGASPVAVSGVPVGASLTVQMKAPAGTSATLARVQVEAGVTASLFERVAPASALLMCQRYYEVLDFVMWSGNVTAGSPYHRSLPLKVTKRAAPDVVVSNDVYQGFGPGLSVYHAGAGAVVVYATANASGPGFYHATYGLDAEL